MGTNRENIVPRNLCTMRANVRHRQKRSSFPLEKLPIQSILSSRSKNSEHPWRSRFASGFSWQYNNLSWSTAFLIVFHFSDHSQRSGLFQIKINAIQNHWMPTNVIGHPQIWRPFLFRLFRVVSGLFNLFYGLFRVAPLFTCTFADITECFGLSIYYKLNSSKFYYKGSQLLL